MSYDKATTILSLHLKGKSQLEYVAQTYVININIGSDVVVTSSDNVLAYLEESRLAGYHDICHDMRYDMIYYDILSRPAVYDCYASQRLSTGTKIYIFWTYISLLYGVWDDVFKSLKAYEIFKFANI